MTAGAVELPRPDHLQVEVSAPAGVDDRDGPRHGLRADDDAIRVHSRPPR